MIKWIRGFVLIFGIILLLCGMTLIWKGGWTPWINNFLMGTTLLSYAISLMWIGSTFSFHALGGSGLGGGVAFAGCAFYLFHLSEKIPAVKFLGELSLYAALFCLWLLYIGLKTKKKPEEKLPLSTQLLLGLVFTVTLFEGIYLVIPFPSHFAWILPIEFSVLYGWVCLGAALYLGWALLHPTWENAYPLLYSILFYDCFLIGPFLNFLMPFPSVGVVLHLLWAGIILIVLTGAWCIYELVRHLGVRKADKTQL